MAGSLKGIVLNIGGDTSNLSKSLRDVDKQAKVSQDNLRQIESALKFDPTSTDMLTAKQKELQDSLQTTESRLELLRAADKTAKQQLDNGEIGIADYAKLQTEIGYTEKKLKGLQDQASGGLEKQKSEMDRAGAAIKELDSKQEQLTHEMKLAEAQYKLTGDKTGYQSEKVRILGEQVATQEKKVEESNAALEEATRLYGEGDERIEQYAKEVDNAGLELLEMRGELKKNTEELETQTNKLKKVSDKLEDFGGKMSKVGQGLTVGVTAPLMGIVAAAGVAWAEVDEALDGIATATGATGDALDGLHDSFKEVFTTMPVEADVVSSAIGEINTQFGFTGVELEEATTYAAKFASINNTQVSPAVKNAKGAIEALGLESSDFSRVLDAVTTASQDTGKSTEELFGLLQKGAPQINDMNLTVEDAAMLLGRMDQAGLDSSRTFGGLSRAQIAAADEGKTLNEVLSEFTEFANSSASETDKLSEAADLFGTRNGPAMYQAAQQGVFDFDALGDSAERSAGVVGRTFEETLDPIDKSKVALNNMKIAGSELFEAVQVAGTPALEGLVTMMSGMADKLTDLNPDTMDLAIKIGAVLIAAGPTITVLGKMTEGAGKLVTGIGKATTAIGEKGFTGGLSSMIGPGGKIMLAVAAIGFLVAAGKKVHDEMKPGTEAIRDMVAASAEMDEAFKATEDGLRQNADIARGLVEELKKYENQVGLTSDEQLRMVALVDQLNALYPELNASIDAETGYLSESTDQLERRLIAMDNELRFEAYRDRKLAQLQEEAQLEDDLVVAKQAVSDAQAKINEINESGVQQWMNSIPILGDARQAVTDWGKGLTDAEQNVELIEEAIRLKGEEIERTSGKMHAAGTAMTEYGAHNTDTAVVVETANTKQKTSVDSLIDKLFAANRVRKEIQDESKEVIKDYYNELERAQQGYIDAVEAFGDSEFKLREASAADLKKYQEDMLIAYLNYESNMAKLSTKVPADVLAEMRKLGPDGAHIIQEYVNMTDEELQPYVDTWGTITGEAMDAALDELKGHPGKAAEEAINTVNRTREELRKGIDEASQAASDTVQAYTDAATGLPLSAEAKAKEAVDKVKQELAKADKIAREEAERTGNSYAEGLSGKKSKVAQVADEMAKGAKAKFGVSGYSDGANLGETFRQGILSKTSVVKGAGQQLGNAAPTGLKNVLQIKSPSRVMRGLADDTADGYELQLYDRVKDIEKAGRSLVDPMTKLDASMGGIGGVDLSAISGQLTAGQGQTVSNQSYAFNFEVHGKIDEIDARRMGVLAYDSFKLRSAAKGG